MALDGSIIGLCLDSPQIFNRVRQLGITDEYFVDDYEKVWRWILRMKKEHGNTPSIDVTEARFSDLNFSTPKRKDFPILLHDMLNRKKFRDFLMAVDEASLTASSPDDLPVALSQLQGRMNELQLRNGKSNIVDLFSEEGGKRMIEDMRKRRSGLAQGIPTGLRRLDSVTGGLQKREMYVVMGRPGLGKSWLDLLFTASAVMHGQRVVLYPLEMTLEMTAIRLYTLFSQKMFGGQKIFRNTDLARGAINKAKIIRFLHILEDKFQGQMLVADIGNMSDPYTVERIDAETEAHKPDMFWVDYITLMRAPGIGRDGGEDHTTVKALSNGIKHIAVRNGCVGGASAQVNREAIKGRQFLPRVENIAYGDAIGQDATGVVSINRKGPHLYYALVKHRHGPEVGRTRCKFFVDEGLIEETSDQDDDEDD